MKSAKKSAGRTQKKMNKNKIVLTTSQVAEIETLKKELLQHKQEYAVFKSFTKICDDALNVANALLNNDYQTFKRYSLKYSKHTAEKMRGIDSLSTYKKVSNICRFMQMHDGICKKCYADKSIKLYKSTLTPVLIYNTLLLKYIDIDSEQIPYINSKYFRFEAFSDLQSAKHFKNLLAVCKKNKNTLFTLWTKAGKTLCDMMQKENIKKLPTNLNIVYSEYQLNKKTDSEYLNELQSVLYPSQAINKNYTNFVKCFIVYDDENKRKNANIYMCKNKCIDCLKCYKKSKQLVYIAEKIH